MKTPTPTINIESTFSSFPYLSGWVGTTDSSGVKTPEVGAYIYIYIDGFLINEPEYKQDTNSYINPLVILSDSNGNWSTLDNTGTKSRVYVKPGAVLTVKAKSNGKEVSDLSIPYVICGAPTPVRLGVPGSFGEYRAPENDDYILYGGISYWEPNNLLKCGNKIIIYSDGYVIGEVTSNKIIGKDAIFPITTNLDGYYLKLRVNNKLVQVPLANIYDLASSTILLNEFPDGIRTQFTFDVLDINATYRVYNNIRLYQDVDYFVFPNSDTNTVTIIFSRAPEASDYIFIHVSYSDAVLFNKQLTGTIDGNNTTFILPSIPNINSFQLYHNGIHLKKDIDFTLTSDTVELVVPPVLNDNLIADYQDINEEETVLYNPTVTKLNTTQYSVPLLSSSGEIRVFKNGIFQKQITDSVPDGTYYLIKEPNRIVLDFLPIAITDDDLITVYYEYFKLNLDIITEYLNQTTEFKENCLHASKYSDVTSVATINSNIVVGDGSNINYYLPQYSFDISSRVFKNGYRQKERTDFTIKDNVITFNTLNESSDLISAILQPYSADIIIQEVIVPYNNNYKVNLRYAPLLNSIQVYKNQVRLNPFGSTPDYTVSDNTIFFATALSNTDIIIIDYQRDNSLEQYIYSFKFLNDPNNINYDFYYNIPTANQNYKIEVFKNGVKLVNIIDYDMYPNKIVFKIQPKIGDKLLIDFYVTSFNLTSNKEQLQIETQATLDLVIPVLNQGDLDLYRLLFGSGYTLSPGKDTDGDFLFYINNDNGDWKYTNINLATREIIPFQKGQHISAKVYNSTIVE